MNCISKGIVTEFSYKNKNPIYVNITSSTFDTLRGSMYYINFNMNICYQFLTINSIILYLYRCCFSCL